MDSPNFSSSSVRSDQPSMLPPSSMPTTNVFNAEYTDMKQSAQTADAIADTLTRTIGSLRTPPEVCQPLPPAVCSAPSALPGRINKGAAATGVKQLYQSLLPTWASHGGQSHSTYQHLQSRRIRNIDGNPRANPLYEPSQIPNQIPSRVPSIHSHGSNVYESVSNGSTISSHYDGHPEDYLVPLMNAARMRENPLYSQPDFKKSCLARQRKCLLCFALVIISVISCFSLAFAILTEMQIFNLQREVLPVPAGLVGENQTLPTEGQVLKEEVKGLEGQMKDLKGDMRNTQQKVSSIIDVSGCQRVRKDHRYRGDDSTIETEWVPEDPQNGITIAASCNVVNFKSHQLQQNNETRQFRCNCSLPHDYTKERICEIDVWFCPHQSLPVK